MSKHLEIDLQSLCDDAYVILCALDETAVLAAGYKINYIMVDDDPVSEQSKESETSHE